MFYTQWFSFLDEDYDIATCSTAALKTNAIESTKKAKSFTERKRNLLKLFITLILFIYNNATFFYYSETGRSSPGTIPEISFKCHTCERTFKYKKNLDAHLKYECEKEPSFSCTLCTYRTATKSSLKRHLVAVHNFNDSDLAAHGLGNS